MRRTILLLAACLAGGCEQKLAEVTYQIRDSVPAVPVYAVQTFEIGEDGRSFGSSFVWGEPLEMPIEGGMGWDEPPAPFRLCAVALGETDEILLAAVSPVIEPVADHEISVDFALEPVADGIVPDPCGPEVEPFPPPPG